MKDDGKIKSELEPINILKSLSMPLRVTISLATAIMGLGIIGFFVVYNYFEEIVKGLGEISMNISHALIILLVCLGIIFVGTFFIACASTVALVRLKILDQDIKDYASRQIEEFSKKVKVFSQGISQLTSQVNQLTLSKYILDEDQITSLESGVSCGKRIIVMTSKFHLDTGKLLQIILNNIKKGAIYQYIIPGESKGKGQKLKIRGTHHADFTEAYELWWKLFQEDLGRDEPLEILSSYDSKYQELKRRVLDGGNVSLVKEDAQEYFSNHVQEYLVSTEYSLITVIMYQKDGFIAHNYDIIIKLPTVSDDNYYAFKIPDEEKVEKKNLTDIVEAFCREKRIPLILEWTES